MPARSCERAALLRPTAEGVRLAVRLRPGGGGDRVDGVDRRADGVPRLRVRVSAPPEAGKANRALLRLLAKAWRLPAGDLTLVSGAKARDKEILVHGQPAALVARLGAWLEGL